MATVIVNPGNTLIVSAPGPQGPAGGGGGGGVTDGDKGDVTVSGGGTTWTIDADAVTFDKIQNVTGPTLLGRQAATAGSAEAITLGSGLSIDGSKQLTITAAYAQQSVTMTAGTGLTGGGDLSANRTFAVAYGSTASTACEGNDARLSDSRTPTAHTHALADLQQGGATTNQVVTWNGSAWAPSSPSGTGTVTSVTGGTGLSGGTITTSGTLAVSYGTTSGTACEGNDSRLSDARSPTAHTHALADLQQGGATTNQVVTWNGSAWAPSSPSGTGTVTSVTAGDGLLGGNITTSGTIDVNFGTAGNTVCEGNDSRLSDARTPTSHLHGNITNAGTIGTTAFKPIITSVGGELVAGDFGTTNGTFCQGNDSRLSDARTPTAHTHALADLQQGGATSGQVVAWNGSAWAPATPSGGGGGGAPPVNEKSVVFDTFLVNTTPDTMVFTAASGGSSGSADIRSDDRVGGVNIDSGASAVANAHATWRMSNSATVGNFDDLASAQYTTEIKGLNLADGTTTGLVYVGLGRFSSTAGSDPSHGVYFRSTDGGNWYAVTRASGTETATDTGVGTNTTTWQRLTVKYTAASCTFYIDGVLKATHSTNIPTTDANYGMSVVKTAAVTTRVRYQVDWVYAELEFNPALSLD